MDQVQLEAELPLVPKLLVCSLEAETQLATRLNAPKRLCNLNTVAEIHNLNSIFGTHLSTNLL